MEIVDSRFHDFSIVPRRSLIFHCSLQVNGENVNANAHQEYILDDDECPLAILMNHPSTRGEFSTLFLLQTKKPTHRILNCSILFKFIFSIENVGIAKSI